MTYKTSHIRHTAQRAGVAIADLSVIASSGGGVAQTLAAMRDNLKRRGIESTIAQARERIEAARPALEQMANDIARGNNRRSRTARKPDLTLTQRTVRQINRLMNAIPGERYSGKTTWTCRPIRRGESPTAQTEKSYGEQYSSRCKYSKTDANHAYSVSLSDLIAARATGLPAAIDGWQVVRAKQSRAGIYEVSLLGSARNQARARIAFAADQGAGRWHLAETERGAITALNRSLRADEASLAARINSALCRAWGWCADGVRQWCERHGIRRAVSARIGRGAKSTAIARLIRRHGGPADSYELRLLRAAGVA